MVNVDDLQGEQQEVVVEEEVKIVITKEQTQEKHSEPKKKCMKFNFMH